MQGRRDNPEVVVRDAATVMLLREGSRGPEVLMVRRTTRTPFGAGKYVFPGGAVDIQDRAPNAISLCHGLDDATASRRLGLDSGGLAHWVAAVRECFEEVGLLLALNEAGTHPMWVAGDALDTRLRAYRRALCQGTATFADMCAAETLHVAAGHLAYISHWITPPGLPRRYSARFFIGLAPCAQPTCVDGRELIAHWWLPAQQALDCHSRGEIQLMVPTRAQLEWLAAFDSAVSALAAAQALDTVKTIAPAEAGHDAQALSLPKRGRS